MGVWQHSRPNSASSSTIRRCTVSLKRRCLLLNVQSLTHLMLILVVLLKNLDVGRHRGLTRRDVTQQTTTAVVCYHWMRVVQHPVLKLMSQAPAPQLNATVVSRGSIQHLYSSLIVSFSSIFTPSTFYSLLPSLLLLFLFLSLSFFFNFYCLLVPFLLLLIILSLCGFFFLLHWILLRECLNNYTMTEHCLSLI